MSKLKICLCHPGADWSVHDVYTGYRTALERMGVEVVNYALSGRIQDAGGWLEYCWRHSKLPKDQRPGLPDYLYLACQGVLERALRHQVDWVLVIAGAYFHPDAAVLLRRAGIRMALLCTESPYDTENEKELAALFDVTFTMERTSVADFQSVCPNSHYLAHAYDPERHRPREADEGVAAHDVVFVGTGWQERVDLLNAVNWEGIDLGLYGVWSLLGSRHRLRRYLRANITPNELTTALYSRAKVGLNLHRVSKEFGRRPLTIEHAESCNPRVFELAACGRFFLSDYREELGEIFGAAVPTFSTPVELESLLRGYLSDEEARRRHAQMALEAVRPHTFDARARELVAVLAGS
jgi:spore maturation protein CgeB